MYLAMATAIVVYALAVATKGLGLDEYWTLFFTDPSRSLAEAVPLWSADSGHPLGFYSFIRSVRELADLPARELRFANFAFLAVFLGVCVRFRRQHGCFIGLFVAILATNYFMVERFSELRSYYGGMALLAVLVLVLREGLRNEGWKRGPLWIGLVLILLAVLNYMSFLAGFALTISGAAILVTRKQFAQSARWAGAAAVAALVMALSLANALRFPLVPNPYTVEMSAFAWSFTLMLAAAAIANLAIFGLAAWQGLLLLRTPRALYSLRDDLRFAGCLLLALALTLLGFGLLNALTEVMVLRQLLGVTVLASALLAELACRARWSRGLAALAVAAALVGMVAAFAGVGLQKQFDRYGSQMRMAQLACPTVHLYAADPQELGGGAETFANQLDAAAQIGYADVARRYGLNFVPQTQPRTIDSRCGALVWMGHFFSPVYPDAEQLATRLGFSATEAATARAIYNGNDPSLLLILPSAGQTWDAID